MDIPKMSCLYFPTTILMIDDSRAFMENIKFGLDHTFRIKLADDTNTALNLLTENKQLSLENRFLNIPDDSVTEVTTETNPLLEINIDSIAHEIYNPLRHSYISTVIVDYNMPQIDGVNFCKKIKHLPLKRIMLTGEASLDIAVSAFNEGIIDVFLEKKSKDLLSNLNKELMNAQKDRFIKISAPILMGLSHCQECLLFDPGFTDFFSKICLENQIIEYYLLDQFGSFVLLDKSGKCHYLIIRSDEEINRLCDIALANKASFNVIRSLQNRFKIPILLTEEHHKMPVSCWDQYLFNIDLFSKASNQYYCLIKNERINF